MLSTVQKKKKNAVNLADLDFISNSTTSPENLFTFLEFCFHIYIYMLYNYIIIIYYIYISSASLYILNKRIGL